MENAWNDDENAKDLLKCRNEVRCFLGEKNENMRVTLIKVS